MTEADTPPPRSWPSSISLFLGRESPHWKHLSSWRHTAVNNYPFHGCYLDFVGILRTLVDESLKPCQKLKQQYLSFFEKPTNYLSFNPIPGWQVLPILTKLVQLCTQQIFELVTAFCWTQNHRVLAFCRLSHRPKTIDINIFDASQKKSKIYIFGSQSPFLLLTSDRCRGRSLDWRWRPDRFTSFATCYVTSVHTITHYLHYLRNIHYLHSLGNVHYSHYL